MRALARAASLMSLAARHARLCGLHLAQRRLLLGELRLDAGDRGVRLLDLVDEQRIRGALGLELLQALVIRGLELGDGRPELIEELLHLLGRARERDAGEREMRRRDVRGPRGKDEEHQRDDGEEHQRREQHGAERTECGE
jgi:hypothetical protein